jgi:hypothetical protein
MQEIRGGLGPVLRLINVSTWLALRRAVMHACEALGSRLTRCCSATATSTSRRAKSHLQIRRMQVIAEKRLFSAFA